MVGGGSNPKAEIFDICGTNLIEVEDLIFCISMSFPSLNKFAKCLLSFLVLLLGKAFIKIRLYVLYSAGNFALTDNFFRKWRALWRPEMTSERTSHPVTDRISSTHLYQGKHLEC